jgi:SAM-dependent methyltransferase
VKTTMPDGFGNSLQLPQYPRSSSYDTDWLIENMMGPHPLWLLEALTTQMVISASDVVLDLGCGKAVTSIFLAKEFGSSVEAVDLWIDEADNHDRICQAQVSDRVHAVHADAMALPFEDEHFDAVVSVDSYHYFGTKPETLPAVLRVLKPGGKIGIVVPGLSHEMDSWPSHLKPWWQDGFDTFHSPEWWRRLWNESDLVEVERADLIPDGHGQWLTWARVVDDWAIAHGHEPYRDEVAMLEADHGNLLGFSRLIARKV